MLDAAVRTVPGGREKIRERAGRAKVRGKAGAELTILSVFDQRGS